jgi:hypothetical protein
MVAAGVCAATAASRLRKQYPSFFIIAHHGNIRRAHHSQYNLQAVANKKCAGKQLVGAGKHTRLIITEIRQAVV